MDIRGNTVCYGCDYQDFGLAGPVFVSYLIVLFMFPHTRRSCCIGGSFRSYLAGVFFTYLVFTQRDGLQLLGLIQGITFRYCGELRERYMIPLHCVLLLYLWALTI